MIELLKLECDFFNLKGLRFQIQVAYPHPDDEIVIDARGTKIKTTRRVITKGKDVRYAPNVQTFSSLFDPQSPKFLQAEYDGSYKIDADPRCVEWLLAVFEGESEESVKRVVREFCDKYGANMIDQWFNEFCNKYH